MRHLVLSAGIACAALAAGPSLAITVNSPTTSAATSGAELTLSWPHTVNAGSNRLLLVGLALESGTTTGGVTYGGTPLVLVNRHTGGNLHTVELWRLVAPAEGTANVVASFGVAREALGGATTFNGVHQTSPTSGFAGNDGESDTASVTVTSAVDDLVVDTVYVDIPGSTITEDPSQSPLWSETSGRVAGGSSKPGAGSVPMTWGVDPSEEWTIAGVSLRPGSISGTVFEDVNGDSGLGDAVPLSGVRVRLYTDANDNGSVDAADAFVEETATDGSGVYAFTVDTVATGEKYLVAIDSKTVPPNGASPFNSGFGQADVWAEQTYGDDPSTPAVDLASRVGGLTAGDSDDVDPVLTGPASNAYQHLARVDVAGSSVSGIDFAFSFQVVSHAADTDDDGGANRTAQGSLRQLVQNANAIVGTPTLAIPAGIYLLAIAGAQEEACLTGDLDVTDGVTLVGAGMESTFVDANGIDRVFDLAANMTLTDLTIRNGDDLVNGGPGGGIWNRSGAGATLTRVALRGNKGTNGGAIMNAAALVMTDVEISGGTSTSDGGGIFNSATIDWTRGTLSGNAASNGGGLLNNGPAGISATFTNVTVSGNSATGNGGGISTSQGVDLIHATVYGNSATQGAGVHTQGVGSVRFSNSVVANHSPAAQACGASNTITQGGNVESPGNSCGFTDPSDQASVAAINLNMGPLVGNGGPTKTHALLTGSFAIDAAIGCPPPATDQRAVARPDGAACDSGAFEGALTLSTISGTVYHDADDSGTFGAGEQGIGTVWVKLVQGGSVLQTVQADPDSGAYSLVVGDGSYDVIVDDNNNGADSTPTAPVNWSFGTPATGLLSVAVAGADVTDQDLGLTFDFDLAADCACGYEDGLFTQVAITIDGDMTDWATVFSDGDNNACDATDDTDLDHIVQSTGRNLLRTAVTWDATYFSMWTQRVGQSNNTQNFVYYADTNVDGIQQNGEPVVVAKWQGNTGNVVLELYSYDDLGSGGDPVLDANGFADGYSMPGDLTFVKTLTMPDGSGQGSTTGNTDGTQMEWTIEWSELGVPAGSAIGWHIGSTNSNPGASGLGAQIDDNLGGCGGQCTGSNQFAGVAPGPIGGGPGEIIYAPHTFTNTGNGADLFDFTWSWTGDFAPASVNFYRDLGTVGEYDPGVDLLLTDTDSDTDPDTGSMAPGATFELLVAIELPGPPVAGSTTVTTTATSNFVPGCGGTVTPVSGSVDDPIAAAPQIVKRAFQSDGTPIANGSTLPAGKPVKFLIYFANYGGALSDLSLRDVLDPVFEYQTGTMKVDNTLAAGVVCPGGVCDEAAIFTQVDGSGTAVGDGDAVTAPIDADEASYDGGTRTLDLGDQNNGNNAQLDVAADSVWTLVFTVRMQ